MVLPVDDDSMVVAYGDEDEHLASYYLIIIFCVVNQQLYIMASPCLGGVGDFTLLLGCQIQHCMCTKLARRSLARRECVARSVWTSLSHYKHSPRMFCCICRVTAMMMSHLMVKSLRLVS